MSPETRPSEPLVDAWRSLAEQAAPTESCPDAERIWAAAWGEAPLEERREIVDHLAVCPLCAEAWRLARELGREPGSAPRQHTAPETASSWTRPLLMAAAALLAAVVGVQIVEWQRVPDDVEYRNGVGATVVSLLDEETPQPREDLVLRWRAPQEAVAYDVRVTDSSLTLLARGRELAEPSFRVPADSLEGVPSGATLFWQVEAIFPDGSRQVSETFLVRVDGASP